MTLEAQNAGLAGRLTNVTAQFVPGKITAICGPNGAGKSTLLKLLAGLLAADAGRIEFDGGAMSDLHPRERAKVIGYLPQSAEVAWDVPVRNIVALGRIPHRDGASEPVAEAMAALDLSDLAERRALTLSGGETARMLLARVLAGEPRWILADEPFAALDLAHRERLLRQFRIEAAKGRGVVVVMHDLALARNHADRVLVLEKGRMAAMGEPEGTLSSALIEKVWGVKARWIGEPGQSALLVDPLG
ncbi:ATP-binding cassette domain-containing protein [Altererythrobacter aurantiacus]|uniref:ATP-binding cassette domain-containing protein n=1 Tax=Parapontixanthobacter aurantiacus TaxID=1463599 RepID=A0A844ZE99_9SPHN|nr:ABC transporter ATP-binding protein [Parapontixanthobacter aurantiacus]MXO85572.1 ATP-binding cassette domain-containing protein [Parapontixanthobacter aurantiacus]